MLSVDRSKFFCRLAGVECIHQRRWEVTTWKLEYPTVSGKLHLSNALSVTYPQNYMMLQKSHDVCGVLEMTLSLKLGFKKTV